MSKYGAKKVTLDGITFDSKAEGRYYEHLLKLKKTGVVEDFEMQKAFTLLDRFAHPQTGRIVRAITYSGPPPKLLLFFDKQGQEIARVNVTDRGKKTHSFSVPKDCVGIKFEGWVKSYDSL